MSWEFPRFDLTLKKVIGEGNFGMVWKGVAEGIRAFNPIDESELSLKSKLANLYKRNDGNDYFVKYFRKQVTTL